MVAYSFQRRFVAPILIGLGRGALDLTNEADKKLAALALTFDDAGQPKTQTIRRAMKIKKPTEPRRHALPGEFVQLYHAQRTKACVQLGVALCKNTVPIWIEVEAPRIDYGWPCDRRRLTTRRELDEFARADGFKDYEAMGLFWYENHHDTMNDFEGRLVLWERIT